MSTMYANKLKPNVTKAWFEGLLLHHLARKWIWPILRLQSEPNCHSIWIQILYFWCQGIPYSCTYASFFHQRNDNIFLPPSHLIWYITPHGQLQICLPVPCISATLKSNMMAATIENLGHTCICVVFIYTPCPKKKL